MIGTFTDVSIFLIGTFHGRFIRKWVHMMHQQLTPYQHMLVSYLIKLLLASTQVYTILNSIGEISEYTFQTRSVYFLLLLPRSSRFTHPGYIILYADISAHRGYIPLYDKICLTSSRVHVGREEQFEFMSW